MLLKKYLSTRRRWRKSGVKERKHELNWLSWRMVINYYGRRGRERERRSWKKSPQRKSIKFGGSSQKCFCLSWPQSMKKRHQKRRRCAFWGKEKWKMCKLHFATKLKRREISMTWANEIKINCEIIYLSVNWVERARGIKNTLAPISSPLTFCWYH